MIRTTSVFCTLCLVLTACTAQSEPAPTEPDAGVERLHWILTTINGQAVDLPEWAPGRRGSIQAWSEGNLVQFEAGCGFSISTHTQPVVVRQASPYSRRCTAQDLELLRRVEAIAADRAQVAIATKRMTISSQGGDDVVFVRDSQMLYPD